MLKIIYDRIFGHGALNGLNDLFRLKINNNLTHIHILNHLLKYGKDELNRICLFVCLFFCFVPGLNTPRITLRMRGLRTAAVRRHVGPAVPTSASFCLQKSIACWVSACFRTPILSLGHPGSFKSAHDLKCMRTQTAPLFNGRRGTTS